MRSRECRCDGVLFMATPAAVRLSEKATTTVGTGVVTSSDGGATWNLKSLPADVPLPLLSSVSCSSAEQCRVAGSEAVPQGTVNNMNGGSSVVLGTTDGGASWSKTTFVVPSGALVAPGTDSYLYVGQISRPTTNTCVGLGIADQGSRSTPTYSNGPGAPAA